MHLGN